MDWLATNALAQVTDTTFGRASTNETNGTMSVKATQHGENGLSVTYITVVVLGSWNESNRFMDEHYKAAVKTIDLYIKNMKSEFKELFGKPLKVKKIDDRATIEAITHSHCSPKKLAYYRLHVAYEIDV